MEFDTVRFDIGCILKVVEGTDFSSKYEDLLGLRMGTIAVHTAALRPASWQLHQPSPHAAGTNRSNRSEYELRRRNIASPLADVRGPAGRTRAIATAISSEIEQNAGSDIIEERIAAAKAAGHHF